MKKYLEFIKENLSKGKEEDIKNIFGELLDKFDLNKCEFEVEDSFRINPYELKNDKLGTNHIPYGIDITITDKSPIEDENHTFYEKYSNINLKKEKDLIGTIRNRMLDIGYKLEEYDIYSDDSTTYNDLLGVNIDTIGDGDIIFKFEFKSIRIR